MDEPVIKIDAMALYDFGQLQKVLGITPDTLTNAINSGRLKSLRLGGWLKIRGQAVLDWMERSDVTEPGQTDGDKTGAER